MKWRKSGKRIAPSCWVRSHGVMNGRFAPSRSTEITKSRSDDIVGRSRTFMTTPRPAWERPARSHIHLDRVPVQLHQVAARLRLALAHQLRQRRRGRLEAQLAEARLQ